MAFALATGRWMTELAGSDLLLQTGFGTVQTAQDHPGWLIATDAMSQLGSPPGASPESPRWRVVFDGYLANGDELAREVRLPAESGKTDPAGLIAALMQDRGPQALDRLIGNFALAAGHCDDGRVVATRDRMGGRTLHCSGDGQDVVLATRSAWALRLTRQSFEPDRAFLIGHFALGTAPPPGRSAFATVAEVMPGERLTLAGGKVESERQTLDLTSDFDYRHPGDCIARFRELLEQAVRTTLPPEGPVACMLSGGLDSGPMAAIADRELTSAGRRLHVCSWQLPEFPDADEGEWIRTAAEGLSEPIDLFDGSALLPFSRTDDSVVSPDLPAFNGFRRLVNECYRRAAGHGCRVVLNGNAGDQLYPPLGLLNIDRLKRRRWRPIWNDLLRAWRAGGIRMILSDPAFRHPLGRIVRPFRKEGQAPGWMTRAAAREYTAVRPWPPELEKSAFPDYAWQLVGSRMAFGRAHESEMPNRFGVDRRDPFHDEALLRFMLNAPFGYSHRNGWDKWIMRQASRGLIPDALRKKRRTGLLYSFFRAGLRAHRKDIRELLFEQETDWQRFVQPEIIETILSEDEHPREVLVTQCVGHALWTRHWSGIGK